MQTALYTAPKATETDVITATSQSDSTKSAYLIQVVELVRQPIHRRSLHSNIKAMAYTNSLVQSGNTYYYVATTVDTTGVESIFANEMPSVIPATLKRQLLRCERCAPTSVVDRVTIRQAMPARMQMNEYLQEIDTQAPLEIRCHNGG